MTHTRTSFCAVWAMVLLLGPLSAQQPPRLSPGQRIRVTAAAAGLKSDDATLLGLSRDTLVIGRLHRHWYGGTDTVRSAVTLRDVQSLDISLGRKSYWTQGLIVGGIVGAVSGALYGAIHGLDVTGSHAYCDSQGWFHGANCSRLIGPNLQSTLRAGMLGTILGALTGVLVGSRFHHERWQVVPLDRIRAAVVAQPRGRLGLGVSLAF